LKILIIVPTLNEEKNISKIAFSILALNRLYLSILFIDDNSSDKSQEEIIKLKNKNKNIFYIFRKKKGIGSAHKDGIRWAFKNKFQYCFTIDADGTHNPLIINKMLNLIFKKKYDIINTNRFLRDNSLLDWPFIRRYITLFRFVLVKIFLKTNLDSSGGFRLYNLNTIKLKHFFYSKNKNYFYLIESLFYFEKLGYKICEVPIKLRFRNYGNSKMKIFHIFDSLLSLLKLSYKNLITY
jgi:dolichol-phosphate mannosyltransferase